MTDRCPSCGKFAKAREEMTERLQKEVEAQRLREAFRRIWRKI